MIKAIKLEKNKKIVDKDFDLFQDALNWMYDGDDYFNAVKIQMTNCFSATGNLIAKEYPGYDNVLFRDGDVINALGYYLQDNRRVNAHGKLSYLVEDCYEKYNNTHRIEQTDLGTISPTHLLTGGMKYTFGVEIETSGGRLPYNYAFANKLNIDCLYDGSISGGEYVTGVLTGDAGFIQLNKVLSALRKTTTINKTCGVHVHIGGADFNKAFTVFSYILGLRIEEEVFTTLPKSRTNNRYCGFLYTLNDAPILDYMYGVFKIHGYEAGVDILYDQIYKAMSYGDEPNVDHNKMYSHKHGRYCGQYHDVPMEDNFRYKWLNLIPCNFNMKGAMSMDQVKQRSTIEFRNHSASLSFTKIRNWTLFCMAFVSFVENNKGKILDPTKKVTMDTILTEVFGRKGTPLTEYFEERKEMFKGTAEASEYKKDLKEKELNKKKDICVL